MISDTDKSEKKHTYMYINYGQKIIRRISKVRFEIRFRKELFTWFVEQKLKIKYWKIRKSALEDVRIWE